MLLALPASSVEQPTQHEREVSFKLSRGWPLVGLRIPDDLELIRRPDLKALQYPMKETDR